jgi:antitoxin PrlF
MAEELVTMGTKGQLVVPKSIRDKIGLKPKDKFLVMGDKDFVFFKKVKIPSIKEDFERITRAASKIAEERGITDEDIAEEIKRVREKS